MARIVVVKFDCPCPRRRKIESVVELAIRKWADQTLGGRLHTVDVVVLSVTQVDDTKTHIGAEVTWGGSQDHPVGTYIMIEYRHPVDTKFHFAVARDYHGSLKFTKVVSLDELSKPAGLQPFNLQGDQDV